MSTETFYKDLAESDFRLKHEAERWFKGIDLQEPIAYDFQKGTIFDEGGVSEWSRITILLDTGLLFWELNGVSTDAEDLPPGCTFEVRTRIVPITSIVSITTNEAHGPATSEPEDADNIILRGVAAIITLLSQDFSRPSEEDENDDRNIIYHDSLVINNAIDNSTVEELESTRELVNKITKTFLAKR